MGIAHEHELHKRRRSRNVGLGLVLGTFILIVFGMTIAKVNRGDFVMDPQPGAATQTTGNGGTNGS
ncbi:hypothetical protein [Sagittula sp. S175]|uniref:hypothetical protein n=1 Tax=Sagittula sp. S175 TaxID=3415129 RepID=UPI003C7B2E8A